MEYYPIIKNLHIITAVLSVSGFVLRAWWMMRDSALLNAKVVRIFPHINDTLLLGAAIYLSVTSQLYPFVEGWLGVKVVLLLGYIIAGIFALKRGKTKQSRLVAFVIALACVSLIFVMAILKPAFG